MIQATVSVPVDRLASFYEMFGQWLANDGKVESGGGWRNGAEWAPNDLVAMIDLYRAISPTARKVLELWAQRSPEWISGSDTADAVGLSGPKALAGTLSSVGKAAGKVAHQLPYQQEDGEVGTSGNYRVSQRCAELFLAARNEVER